MIGRGGLEVLKFWMACNDDEQVIIDGDSSSSFSTLVFHVHFFLFHECIFSILFFTGKNYFFCGVSVSILSWAKNGFQAHFVVNFQNFS